MVNLLKDMKIKAKLISGFSIVIVFFLIAISATFINIKQAEEQYTGLLEVNQKILLTITELEEAITKMSLNMRGYLVYHDDKFYNDYLKQRDIYAEDIKLLEQLFSQDNQKVDLSKLNKLEQDYYLMAQEILEKGKMKDYEGASKVAVDKGRGIAENFAQEISKHTEEQKVIIEEEIKESSKKINYTLTILLSLAAIAVVVAIIATLTISYFVNSPISELNTVMQKVADGDLRIKSRYESKDELGSMTNAFNLMLESLKDIITKINDSSVSLLSSTQQISASTQQIAAGSEEQANASQAINTLTNEMASAIEEVAKSAEQGAISSHQAVEVAKKGAELATQSVSGMDAINERINALEVNSQQIGEIVNVIDDVAEQTNLLALNAAIEAARAGDAGKGFAVVADEVRKLAERSSAATKDIAQLIKSIQKNTGDTVKVVMEGTTLTKHVGSAFEDIVKAVEVTSAKVSEIAAASEEQAAQATEVVNSVQSIVSITEETSAGAEETAATSQEISRMAEELSRTVSRFRLS